MQQSKSSVPAQPTKQRKLLTNALIAVLVASGVTVAAAPIAHASGGCSIVSTKVVQQKGPRAVPGQLWITQVKNSNRVSTKCTIDQKWGTDISKCIGAGKTATIYTSSPFGGYPRSAYSGGRC